MLDLTTEDALDNPFPQYKILRQAKKLEKTNPGSMWTLSRHEEVLFALDNPNLFSSAAIKTVIEAKWLSPRCRRHLCLVHQDPPEHTKYRNLIGKAFSNINRLVPTMEEKASCLIDKAKRKSSVEVFSDISFPYSGEIIGRITGTHETQNIKSMFHWAQLVETLTPVAPEPSKIQELETAILDQQLYFSKVIEAAQADKRDDFLSDLVNAEINGERPSDNMLNNAIDLIIRAGFLSTGNTLGTALFHLSKAPKLFNHLKEQPNHIPLFINEILRFYSPSLGLLRKTTEPILIRNTTIPVDETVLLLIGSANHDPTQFEEPDVFDMFRCHTGKSLAFGAGPHICLGAALARLELKIALQKFLSKVETIHCIEQPQWKKTYLVRSLEKLRMSFS